MIVKNIIGFMPCINQAPTIIAHTLIRYGTIILFISLLNIFISYKNKLNSDLQLNDLILLNLTGVNAYSDKAGNNYYIFSADKIIHTEVSGLSSYFYIFRAF